MAIRTVMMGAGGREFHNFNVVYRDDPQHRVVAFTAAQIPNIDSRRYPPELAGPLYPEGIRIVAEETLGELIRRESVRLVVFAYSDASHQYVMERAALVGAAGADFLLLGPEATSLRASLPVVAVTAVRTGCGKSQTTRRVCELLREKGMRVAVVRHPMAYGDLGRQKAQRFAGLVDLDRHECTIEEREEYEPHLERGHVVFAGVDYAEVLSLAQKDADILVWDGGNNDYPFLRPDLHITVTDPHRAGHENTYYPGSLNIRAADVVVINKVDSAPPEAVERLAASIGRLNPKAPIVRAASPFRVDRPDLIKGRRVLVIEDGPTVTHGDMPFGAATLAARRQGAAAIIDPRAWARGSLAEVYRKYPHLGAVLPAMGYGKAQIADLASTIREAAPECVVSATPVNLARIFELRVPLAQVTYELEEVGQPDLRSVLEGFPPG